MPPKPVTPTARVSSTCGRRSAPSSVRDRRPGPAAIRGTTATTAASVNAARTTTAQYAERQPKSWPSHVAAGTPATLATDRPSITELTARPRCAGATSEAATSEATPK